MFRFDVLVVIIVVSYMEVAHFFLFCVEDVLLKWVYGTFTAKATKDSLENVDIMYFLCL